MRRFNLSFNTERRIEGRRKNVREKRDEIYIFFAQISESVKESFSFLLNDDLPKYMP